MQKRNRLTDIENKLVVTKVKSEMGRDRLGVYNYQIQITMYKVKKQQRYIV